MQLCSFTATVTLCILSCQLKNGAELASTSEVKPEQCEMQYCMVNC